MNSGGWQNWARLGALGVIWGASFMLVEIAIRDFGPLSVAAYRLVIAALILLPIGMARGALPHSPRIWLFALGAAVFSHALPFSLLSWAQGTVPSSVAGVFMAAVPLIVLPLSHVFVPGEDMTARKTLGLLIGFAGVMVLIGAEALTGLGGGGLFLIAQLACLSASCCYAIGSVMMKRAPKSDPLGFAALAMAMAAAMALPLALWREGVPAAPDIGPVLALLVLGALPTALALLLILAILNRAGPPFLSLVNYQVPLWAMLFGGMFLGEPIPTRLGIALVMILTGLAISQNLMRRIRGG